VGYGVEPPEKSKEKFLGLPVCGMTMTVDINNDILAGFSVEMILIAQTVIVMIFTRPLLMS